MRYHKVRFQILSIFQSKFFISQVKIFIKVDFQAPFVQTIATLSFLFKTKSISLKTSSQSNSKLFIFIFKCFIFINYSLFLDILQK